MKRKDFCNLFIIAAVLILAGAGIAMAHDGWGSRGRMGGYGGHVMGPGYGPMMGYHNGPGYGDLSEADYNKLEAANEKFFEQTRDLREQLDEKRFALEKEWAKENPDAAKIKDFQNDISKLRSEFDAKRVEHELEVRKMMPESARGRGYAGGYRGGNCW
jgi:Spy/CpxP family protein refolding chaperone